MNENNKLSVFMEKEYAKSLDFWNECLGKEQEIPQDINTDTEWLEIGSKELANAAASLCNQNNVLDYGCGSGWASVIMVKKGCPHVTAVDVSANGIKASMDYAKIFGVDKQIEFHTISTKWLEEQPDNRYDGLFCSNVLDVVPSAICNNILKGIFNVCKSNAKIVLGFNSYFEHEYIEKRGLVEMEPNHLFSNGILRLVNHSDEEWIDIFSPYFKVVECKHFRWDGEPDTANRRLFFLEKRRENIE